MVPGSTIFKDVYDLIFQITLMLVVDAVITFTAWLPRSIGLVYAELNNDKDINLVAGMISWLIRMLIISSSRLLHLNTSAWSQVSLLTVYDVNFKSLSPIHYLKVASSLYRCRQLEHIVQFDFDKLAESTLFWVTNTASG